MNHTTSKITNMTEGNPVRIIMAFAVPLFIGNVFQQIYNLVDTMIAGHFLGDGAIAAIGATLHNPVPNIWKRGQRGFPQRRGNHDKAEPWDRHPVDSRFRGIPEAHDAASSDAGGSI